MTHLQTTKQWKTLGLTTRQIGNARRSGERVTVRFESRDTPPGPVRTFALDDEDLEPAPLDPLPLALPDD